MQYFNIFKQIKSVMRYFSGRKRSKSRNKLSQRTSYSKAAKSANKSRKRY